MPSGPGAAGDAQAGIRPDEPRDDDLEIVDDEGAGKTATGAPPVAWRGPSPRRWILFAAIAALIVLIDQAAKGWVAATLPNVGDGMQVIGDWLRIVHWRNSGALFGLLPQSATAFALVSLGVAALIVVYHAKAGRGIVTTIALALLLGGAIGNLLDRLNYGSVLDFVDMGIGTWRFYTYNLADAAITTAIIMLIVMAIFPRTAEWGTDA